MNKIPQGVGFISAARATERSYEKDDFNHGVFTYCLVEGLSGAADGNEDGKVTFDEIVQYLDRLFAQWRCQQIPRVVPDKDVEL